VIHRTFRSLDEAPKLVGFTLRQWALLIAGASVVLGLVYLVHLPTKAAITLCVFTIGLPAALTYVSESGGLQLGVLLGDMWRWRWSAHALPQASPEHASARGLMVLAWADEPHGADHGSEYDASLDDLLSRERWG
jgi:PrgI family protein